jgi:hypothetical protein
MDISSQIMKRSARLGIGFVILSFTVGVTTSFIFNYAARFGPNVQNFEALFILPLMLIPFASILGLLITTPVNLLFVHDKNVGVLEYLLAVGMDQREIFVGYFKAAIALCVAVVSPIIMISIFFSPTGFYNTVLLDIIAAVTSISDVSMVTILTMAFSSMQRRPTGINTPLGITIGMILILPEVFLLLSFGPSVFWVDVGMALLIFIFSVSMLLLVNSLISREKFLP